jgi:3-hydroxybutyryl-CoA dehydrogenase
MNADQINTVAVIGAGLMGHGIALDFAASGRRVLLHDSNPAVLAGALERVRRGAELLVESGRLRQGDVSGVVRRITPVATIAEAVRQADLVVEAIFEDLGAKRAIFAEAARHAPPRAVLASNSSSFMPSELAGATDRPDRVAVAHYFNPPYLVPLVEVVRGPQTSESTVQALMGVYQEVGKAPVTVNREMPGFIANRLQNALGREAQALVDDGVATAQDIDNVVKYGFGRRLAVAGPFEVWELIGWDLVATIGAELWKDISGRAGPSRTYQEKLAAGDLGVKTGRGFYDWTPESAEHLRLRVGRALIALDRMARGAESAASSGRAPRPRMVEGIRRVAVIGAGLMGHGIAAEFAAAGYEVALADTNADALTKAPIRARAGLELMAEAGRVGKAEIEDALLRIRPVAGVPAAVRSADLVVEAVSEDLSLKRRIFAEADAASPAHAVLLSNTSTFLPSALASATARADRVAVAHYFNPPHLLPVVELVRGPGTSDRTVSLLQSVYSALGKRPALVSKERLGFIGNRLQFAMFRESLSLVQQGVVTAPELDVIVRNSFGRRLSVAGPFELRDLIGLDLASQIGAVITPTLDNSTAVPPVLAEKVRDGQLGTKTGRGFYDWTPESAEALRLRIGRALVQMASWPG